MAKKKSVLFYLDNYTPAMKGLSYEQKGMLFDAVISYAGGIADTPDDLGMLSLALDPIKAAIDRDNEKYVQVCERNRKNGKKGGKPKVTHSNPKKPSGLFTNPNKPDNDTDTDTDTIQTKIEENKKEQPPAGGDDLKKASRERIIKYLNAKLGTSFKPNSIKTKSTIEARLNEGFSVEDFKPVIDNQILVWGNDNDMKKFLRPETLFGPKFEGYLQATKMNVTPESSKPKIMTMEEIEELNS